MSAQGSALRKRGIKHEEETGKRVAVQGQGTKIRGVRWIP